MEIDFDSLFYSLPRIELTWIAQAGIALDAMRPSLMLDNPWWLLMIILDGRSLAHIWPATPPSMMVILELIATHEMGTMINHLISFWDHRCIWAHLIWFAFTFTTSILSSIYKRGNQPKESLYILTPKACKGGGKQMVEGKLFVWNQDSVTMFLKIKILAVKYDLKLLWDLRWRYQPGFSRPSGHSPMLAAVLLWSWEPSFTFPDMFFLPLLMVKPLNMQ